MNPMIDELHVSQIEVDPRQEWLEKRRSGIGGSEAPIIMGIGYKSQYELWADKSGLLEESEEEREQWEWGNILEDPLAQRYVLKTGRTLIDHGRFAIVHSNEWPFMHCTIDREIACHTAMPENQPRNGPGSLSIKNAGWYMEHEWLEEPPLAFQVQMQHELAVHNWQWGSFAVLLGGNKFRWCDTVRNNGFISHLIEREDEFMDRVRRQDPPDPDASQSARETILRLHPMDNGRSIILPPEAYYWSKVFRQAKAAKKQAEADILQYQNLLESRIGDATLGLFPNVDPAGLESLPEQIRQAIVEHPREIVGHTWKHQHRNSYTVAEVDFRVMRDEKQNKGGKRI
jgi:putative phage-type endonuclease